MATRSKAPAPKAEEAKVESTPTPEVKTEAPDITEFSAAAEATVTSTDETPDFTQVTAAYQALDRRGKAAASKFVNDQMLVSLKEKQDKDLALAWMQLGDAIKTKPAAEKKAREPKPPANPTETYIDRLAGLYLAYEIAGQHAPEGLDEDWNEKLQAKLAEVRDDVAKLVAYRDDTSEEKGDAPEVDEIASRAVRMAFTGSTRRVGGSGSVRTYEGPRRSVGQHILSAFASVPSGTFLSVSEIRNHKSDEYGEDSPSAGAISAALKGKSVPEGVVPGNGGEKNTFGATKA